MELDNLIKLAHKVAAPYKFCVWLLAVLLVISLALNAYLATKEFNITFGADDNAESEIIQTNNS